jgi:REP element-mobilizing transposase RayT
LITFHKPKPLLCHELFHRFIQIVFAVKNRQNFISPSSEDELYKYISGIITAKEQKSLAVNGMPDHVHLLVGLKPSMRISDLVRDIKNNSTNFINKRG